MIRQHWVKVEGNDNDASGLFGVIVGTFRLSGGTEVFMLDVPLLSDRWLAFPEDVWTINPVNGRKLDANPNLRLYSELSEVSVDRLLHKDTTAAREQWLNRHGKYGMWTEGEDV